MFSKTAYTAARGAKSEHTIRKSTKNGARTNLPRPKSICYSESYGRRGARRVLPSFYEYMLYKTTYAAMCGGKSEHTIRKSSKNGAETNLPRPKSIFYNDSYGRRGARRPFKTGIGMHMGPCSVQWLSRAERWGAPSQRHHMSVKQEDSRAALAAPPYPLLSDGLGGRRVPFLKNTLNGSPPWPSPSLRSSHGRAASSGLCYTLMWCLWCGAPPLSAPLSAAPHTHRPPPVRGFLKNGSPPRLSAVTQEQPRRGGERSPTVLCYTLMRCL